MEQKKTNNRAKTKRTNNRPPQRRPIQRNVQRQMNSMSDDKRIAMRTAQRRKKNKRKRIFIRTLVILLFIVIGVIVSLTVFFNIDSIKVTGETKYSNDEIINASGIKIDDNLIFMSEENINDKVTKELPYIEYITIKKHLPTTVEIVVKQTEAVYAVPQNGTYTLLNENGKVLEKEIEFVGENLIFLNAGELNSAELKAVKSIRDALNECEYEKITLIDASDIYNIKFIYDGRITFQLGEINKSNLLKKLRLGKSALDRQNEENEQYRGTINLTVEGKGYWSEEVLTTVPPKTEETTENQDEVLETTVQNKEEETTKKV